MVANGTTSTWASPETGAPHRVQDFLTTALREALEPRHGWQVRREPSVPFDVAGRVTMNPDIVWYRGGEPAAVADAKYKWEGGADNLYQLLAYCTALGLRRGHLVYAAGAGTAPHVHVVHNAGGRSPAMPSTSPHHPPTCSHRWLCSPTGSPTRRPCPPARPWPPVWAEGH